MPFDVDQHLRIDKNRTNIALGYKEGIDPICKEICPDFKMPSSGKYPSYGAAAWLMQEDTESGSSDRDVQEILFPAESWNEYVVPVHRRKVFVSDEKENNAGYVQKMPYTDKGVATKALVKFMNQSWCYKVTTTVLATGNSANPGTKWDEAGATPFDDFVTWVKAVKDAIGLSPSGLIIPIRALYYLGDNARVHYNHTGMYSNYEVVSKMLMQDLGVKNLYISDADASDGSTFSSVWGKNVILFRSAKAPLEWEPTYLANVVPNDKNPVEILKPYPNSDHTGVFIQERMRYLVKELDSNAVYLGSNVIN